MLTKAATVRKFRQAAMQRLATAEFLLRNRINIDSMYLAGYGVECALITLIVARTPDRGFAATIKRITSGQKAQDYEALKDVLKRHPISLTFPAAVAVQFRRVRSWKTALRYEVGRGDPEAAAVFLVAATEIVLWAESML